MECILALNTEYPLAEEQNTTLSESKGEIARKLNDESIL